MRGGEYCIWIVSPPGYSHSRCFEEVALALNEAFEALGFDARIVTDPAQIEGVAIVLGANLLSRVSAPPRTDMILYNLEQVTADSTWITADYLAQLRRYRVWDYSARNVTAIAPFGVRPILCGIGYTPGLTRIALASEQDIDVLFIGSFNPRRRQVLNQLHRSGKKVFAAFDVYGEERDALFARAKIVLNVHYFDAKVFEIVRVSYLVANRICVVSETGGDPDLEAPLKDGVAFASYDKLVETCLALLDDPAARARIAQRGFELFSRLSQVDMLKSALATTPDSVPAGP
jgi:hypothetical protein